MIQQSQKTPQPVQMLTRAEPQTPAPDNQPVYFFDGDFRTWGQAKQRAQFNGAVNIYLAKSTSTYLRAL